MFFRRFRLSAGHLKKVLPGFSTAQDSTSSLIAVGLLSLCGLMQYGGPIVFNEVGDNPNAISTMIQILGHKPVAVWPKDAALQKFVFPRPKA
jgi:hypothetical protein